MIKKLFGHETLPATLITAALSFLCAFFIALVYLEKWNNVYLLLIAAVIFVLIDRFSKIAEKRLCILSAVFSLCLAVSVTLSTLVDTEAKALRAFSGTKLAGTGVLFIVLFFLAATVIEGCAGLGRKSGKGKLKLPQKLTPLQYAIIAAAVISFVWLLFFLMYYPAATSIDSENVIKQVLGEYTYSDAHPFTYTLFAKLFIGIGLQFGSLSVGVALFALAHLVLQCAAAVYMVWWMAKNGANILFLMAVTLYFASSPVFASLSITLWKDIPFSSCIVIYTIQLYEVVRSNGKRLATVSGSLKFILIAFFSSMLRHNGFYVIIMVALFLLVYYAVRMRKVKNLFLKILPALLVPLVLVPAVRNIYYFSGVEPGKSSEAVSIPAQQMARTVLYGGNLTEAQMAEFELFFDRELIKAYNPFLSDPVKGSINKAYFDAHKGDFMKLWLSMMPSNLKEYVKAYILQTCGYWIPGIKQIPVDPNAAYITTLGVEKQNFLAPITGKLAVLQAVSIHDYLSLGTDFWLFLLFGAVLFYRKNWHMLIVFLPVLGVWGTLMAATPVHCSYRYIYALPLALPVFLFLVTSRLQVDKEPYDEKTIKSGKAG